MTIIGTQTSPSKHTTRDCGNGAAAAKKKKKKKLFGVVEAALQTGMPGSKRTGTRIHRWFSRPFAHAESTHSKRTLSFYILLLLLGRLEGRAPIQSRKQKESLSFEKSRWNVSFHSFFKLGRRAVVTNRRTEIKSLRSGEGGLFYCWDFLLLLLLLLHFCSKRPIGFSS